MASRSDGLWDTCLRVFYPSGEIEDLSGEISIQWTACEPAQQGADEKGSELGPHMAFEVCIPEKIIDQLVPPDQAACDEDEPNPALTRPDDHSASFRVAQVLPG
jgi:hypothetical protein